MSEINKEDIKEEVSSSEVNFFAGKGDDVLSKHEQVEQLAQELGINHKKLMWKIDAWVIPPFCLLYFLAFLDRVNISNANVYGLSNELKLTGTQYNTALTLFFVPYIAFEVLSNYAIKIVAPHIWLSILILCFGGVSIGMAFVQNFGGLAACRFLLGVFESGSFPALFYILANFYEKGEAQRRFSAFFSVTCLAGAASGAIAYRMNELDGKAGLSSWRWIFLIDGIITCVGSIVLFFTIADFPEEARFLNENERAFIKRKLEIHSGTVSGFETHNKFGDVLKCFKDIMIWLSALGYFGLIVPSYGYAYFSASIINKMGYSAVQAQQHSVYPWLAAFGVGNIVSYFSDRFRVRLPFALGACVVAITGLSMILASKKTQVRYAGCFLTASGLYTAMPVYVCWTSINFGGHLRKSVGTSWQIGFGNIGGIIATFIFLAKDAPFYKPGLSISLAFVAFAASMMVAYFFVVHRNNQIKKSDAYQNQWETLEEREKILAGDKNPEFTYLY